MDTIVTIIILWVAIVNWQHIGAGIGGAIIFGLIGSLFGMTGAGAFIGFFIGIGGAVAKEKEEAIQEAVIIRCPSCQKKIRVNIPLPSNKAKCIACANSFNINIDEYGNVRADRIETGNQSENNNVKIIRCPTCKKKIRVILPLHSNKGKCSACSNSFNINIDEYGDVRAEKIETGNQSENNHDPASVSEHFKVLGIEATATPDEVRAAYKNKIREYHPDRVVKLGEKLRQVAEDESKAINIAYSSLKSKGLAT